MNDDLQAQALGRVNAACAVLFALLERHRGDKQTLQLLSQHFETARSMLLATSAPDRVLAEFEKTVAYLTLQAKTPPSGPS